MKKAALVALGILAFVALLAWSTLGGRRHRVEVCMEYQGLRRCSIASGATQEEAQRTAISNACTLITNGMTELMACERSRPASVRWNP